MQTKLIFVARILTTNVDVLMDLVLSGNTAAVKVPPLGDKKNLGSCIIINNVLP